MSAIFKENDAPATPALGYVVFYAKSDKKLYFKDDAGVEYPVKPIGGGTGDLLSDGSVPLVADWDIDGFYLTNVGAAYLAERAAADTDVAGQGQIWVKNATPNELWFTDDAGTDVQLGVAGGGEFTDSTFRIKDNGDATKKVAFEVSAVATGTTRTITMPNANVNLGTDFALAAQANATHTGEVTGATALTLDKTAISNRSTVTVAATDTILIGDASDSNNLAKIVASDFVASASLGANVATFLATPSSANLAAALTDESNSGVVPFLTSNTFTPTIQDDSLSNSESQTYTAQSGSYVRIGNVVFIRVDITINSLGTLTTSQVARIAGLPFSPIATATFNCGYADSLAITAGNSITGVLSAGEAYITLMKFSATTGCTNLTIAELSTGGRIIMNGFYFA